MTRETVATDTPASRATSFMVAIRFLLYHRRNSSAPCENSAIVTEYIRVNCEP
ncbi:Uncharacterised protein [Vibrio cholerae]|nr:Uncharacterised protein [Vibrio cholerae]CSD47519.1 Uncharacterised protein [Vibrio cholerae]